MHQLCVQLNHGLKYKGAKIKTASIREMNGYDQQYLEEIKNIASVPSVTTGLLARIVTFGTDYDQNEFLVRRLSLGDRMLLLLHLRELIFGDRISCITKCPTCSETLSLNLSVKKIVTQLENPRLSYSKIAKIKNYKLKIHTITGKEIEDLAKYSRNHHVSDDSIESLIRMCVVWAEPKLPEKLTVEIIDGVSEELEKLDPNAEMTLTINCSICQNVIKTPFVVEEFVFEEMKRLSLHLVREIHWLAFNYHWSEKSILLLPYSKRKKYVELVNETMDEKY